MYPTKICFVRSAYDLPTTYANAWLAQVITYAKTKGYYVIDLENPTKEEFEETIQSQQPLLVIGSGHGESDVFAGKEREIILKKCTNDHLLATKICYLIACNTALELGPSAVNKGALAYIGWQEDFVFAINAQYIERPTEDPYAYAFFDTANKIGYALLEGKTVKESYELAIQNFNKWIKYWRGVGDPMAQQIITWLYWDRDNLIAITKEGLYTIPAPEMPYNLTPLIIMPAGLLAVHLIKKL